MTEEVLMMQAAIAAGAGLSDGDLAHVKVLIRLTVEFRQYLRGDVPDNVRGSPQYLAESIFSGVDSFCAVNSACRSLGIALPGRVSWKEASVAALTREFLALFDEFAAAADFPQKCRLLLDLFRLQIVVAGILYE